MDAFLVLFFPSGLVLREVAGCIEFEGMVFLESV